MIVILHQVQFIQLETESDLLAGATFAISLVCSFCFLPLRLFCIAYL